MPKKILIDTDIGDDIDDALALALAIGSGELELEGVTTVFLNSTAWAKIAARLLRAFGAEGIPVVPGATGTMSALPEWVVDPMEIPPEYAPDMEQEEICQETSAAAFLAQKLMGAEAPMDLVAIGPLTNIAELLIRYPQCKERIRCLHLMGGAYYAHVIEYNIHTDAEAARVVFASGIPIRAVGLDVTLQCRLAPRDLDWLRQSDSLAGKALWNCVESFCRHHPGSDIILHDALAVAAVFRPELIGWQQRRIAVETRGEYTTGMTVNLSDCDWWLTEDSSHIQTAKTVNRDELTALFLERLREVCQ